MTIIQPVVPKAPEYQMALASWAVASSESAIQRVLSMGSAQRDVISFALGRPDTALFPEQEYRDAERAVWTESHDTPLQYQPSPSTLRHHIAVLARQRGVSCSEDEVFVTAGAQQGLSLLARLLLDPHSVVAAERLNYPVLWQTVDQLYADVLEVPAEPETGMDIDALAAEIRSGKRPAFIYTVPDGHNPLGVSLPAESRERLVTLAREYGIPIIADDAYGFLNYSDKGSTVLGPNDRDVVIHVGTFSKILAPALRVGWVIAPAALVSKLAIAKEGADINTATLSQHALSFYLAKGSLSQHVVDVCRVYRARRDAMLRAIELYLPQARVHEPLSGFFIWLELPEHLNADSFVQRAFQHEGVIVLPESAFQRPQDSRQGRGIRLSFVAHSPDRITEGVRRLARAAEGMVSEGRAAVPYSQQRPLLE